MEFATVTITMSTSMSLSTMRQTVKANARKLNAIDPTLNLKAGDVSQMDAKTLAPLIELLNAAPAEETAQSNTAVAVESDSTVVAKDGTIVPTVRATFLHRSNKGNFMFLAAGRTVMVDDSNLCAVALTKGGLPVGYEVQLKPDSFEEIRVGNGDVIIKARINYAASGEVDQAAKFSGGSDVAKKDYIALAKMNGVSGKKAAEMYDEEIKAQLSAMVKPRVFTLQ